jgi:hypothetical protein
VFVILQAGPVILGTEVYGCSLCDAEGNALDSVHVLCDFLNMKLKCLYTVPNKVTETQTVL